MSGVQVGIIILIIYTGLLLWSVERCIDRLKDIYNCLKRIEDKKE